MINAFFYYFLKKIIKLKNQNYIVTLNTVKEIETIIKSRNQLNNSSWLIMT
jgi:hypothetical protein